jgi:hypothetical protein
MRLLIVVPFLGIKATCEPLREVPMTIVGSGLHECRFP